MSTKTTFKRIALVAVASLGFGMLSVAPSQAANMVAATLLNAADGSSAVSSTATIGGSASTAKIVYSAVSTTSSATATVSGTISSVPATSGAFNVSFAETGGTSPDSTSPAASFTSPTISTNGTGRVTQYLTASFTPDVAGTYVIALKSTTDGVTFQTVTWTITVAATPAATASASVIAYKSAAAADAFGALNYFMYDGGGPQLTATNAAAAWKTEADATAAADGSFYTAVTTATTGTVVGSGLVSFSNATLLTSNTHASVPMTVSISGRGYVRIVSAGGTTSYGTSVTETAAVGFTPYGNYGKVKSFQVMSDGTSGPATVTISAEGVTLGTVSLVFTGAKASLDLATGTTTKLSKSYIGSGESATVTINAKDAGGNILGSSGITAVTGSDSTGTIATATFSGDVVTVTGGLVSGTVTWTVTDGTRTTTFVTNTTKKTAKTVTITASNTTPVPGEKVTLTITAKDSNGSPVADGGRALLGATGITTNLSVGSSTCPIVASVTLVSGVATCSFFATFTSGTLNISATEGAAVDNVIAGGTAATISLDLAVANAALDQAQAATDAAAEATDAANAATDAANAAAEAADAATAAAQDAADAVAALSTQVAEMINALKKQITSLTNLVIKIQKKVKA
jgi:hypothetical protein